MKFGCSIGIFLDSANLICRSTDIWKSFRGSLQLQDNESRLYSVIKWKIFFPCQNNPKKSRYFIQSRFRFLAHLYKSTESYCCHCNVGVCVAAWGGGGGGGVGSKLSYTQTGLVGIPLKETKKNKKHLVAELTWLVYIFTVIL